MGDLASNSSEDKPNEYITTENFLSTPFKHTKPTNDNNIVFMYECHSNIEICSMSRGLCFDLPAVQHTLYCDRNLMLI